MSRKARSGRLASLGQLLPLAVKGLRLERAVVEQQLLGLWPEIAGAKLAAHTRAIKLERGVLVVAVDDPGWLAQLVFLKPKLLAKVAGRARKGAITDLRFTLGRTGPSRS
jgi:predicted nucleic acid-binding Zn ribbon protein